MPKFKSNSVIHTEIDAALGRVSFAVKGHDVLVLSLDDLHPGVVRYAALHGLKQRVHDAAAIDITEDDSGEVRRPSAAEKFEAMQRLVSHYLSGTSDWTLRGPAQPRQSLVLRCLVEAFPEKPREALETYVVGLGPQAKRKLLAAEPLRSIAERIRAAEAPDDSAASAEALLAEVEQL